MHLGFSGVFLFVPVIGTQRLFTEFFPGKLVI